jgi:hypothetical protein
VSFDELFPRPPAEEDDDDGVDDDQMSMPAWHGPPNDELGIAVPEAIVVGRSENGVVALSHVLAYSTGVQFDFVGRAVGIKQSRVHAMFHAQHNFGMSDDESPTDEFLRIGLEFSDGVRVSNLSSDWWRGGADDTEPEGPVFHHASGGGGGMSGTHGAVSMSPSYWLWPLPPAGPLRVWCEWPVVGIDLVSAEIDASSIVAAAARTVPLQTSG